MPAVAPRGPAGSAPAGRRALSGLLAELELRAARAVDDDLGRFAVLFEERE
jgi:hypothetical protein